MRFLTAATLLFLCACSSTPEQQATDRFEKCMDATLPSFGPVKVATADQRIRAAEVCKSVMSPDSAALPAERENARP
jgi:hypothetical protein